MYRAADYIIQHGIDRTESGSWCVYFEELQEHLGLNIQAGNGLDSMLRAALKRRPEAAAVDMHDGCIEMEYRRNTVSSSTAIRDANCRGFDSRILCPC